MQNKKTLWKDHEVECVTITINETQHPKTFKVIVDELIKSGMTEKEAKIAVRNNQFSMEVYYEPGQGLFLVESEACECCPIFSPYTKEEFQNPE